MLVIDADRCLACAGCLALCPQAALFLNLIGLNVNHDLCTLCGICARFCPVTALSVSDEVVLGEETR